MDEPLQVLTEQPWEVRNAIPLVPPGHIRMLDAIEHRLESGTPSPGLAAYLARAGYAYVVVRNDLDPGLASTTRPALVHQALERSGGFSRVASFGPDVSQAPTPGIYLDGGLRMAAFPAVEVYAVAGTPARATLTPADDVLRLTGGPESLLDLADAGLSTSASVLMAQDPPELGSRIALADGLVRREVNFGRSLDNASAALTREQPLVFDRPASDYAVGGGVGSMTVAEWDGVENVTVSSSTADVDTPGGPKPATGPAAAFDGTTTTAWLAASTGGEPVSMAIDIGGQVVLPSVSVALPASTRAQLLKIRVVTSDDDVEELVDEGTGPIVIPLAGVDVDRVRVELYPRTDQRTLLGIAELSMPPLQVRHHLAPPGVELDGPDEELAMVMSAAAGHRDGCVVAVAVLCSSSLPQRGEEDEGIRRRVELSDARAVDLAGQAAARPGDWLDSIVLEGTDLAAVAASSVAVADPLAGPLAVVDGDDRTGWVASALDSSPSVTVSWRTPQTITGLDLDWADELAASRAGAVVVEAGGEAIRSAVDPDGHVDLPPLTDDAVVVRFTDALRAYGQDPDGGELTQLPIGLSDLRFDGADASIGRMVDSLRPVSIPCGEGPALDVDGRRFETAVDLTVDELTRLAPVDVRVCDSRQQLLEPGRHDLTWQSSGRWRPVRLTMLTPGWTAADDEPTAATLDTWARGSRAVDVPARSGPMVLTVNENANAGWVATLDGKRLQTVEVDGWMQGYVVPAGEAGTVQLRFEPGRGYQAALGVGFGLLALVGVGALVPGRRTSTLPAAGPARPRVAVRLALVVVAAAALAGLVGVVIAAAVVAAVLVLDRAASCVECRRVGLGEPGRGGPGRRRRAAGVATQRLERVNPGPDASVGVRDGGRAAGRRGGSAGRGGTTGGSGRRAT